MSIEELLNKYKSLIFIVESNSDLLAKQSFALLSQLGLSSLESLRQAFDKIESEDRLLQLGIIGKVKAGKSSLLNALFFDGQSVLPKAATPMTAALTTMTWGEEIGAEVEFYSKKDIRKLEERSKQYEKHLKDEIESLREKSKNQLTDYMQDLQKIERRAKRNLAHMNSYLAAFDQVQKINSIDINRDSLSEDELKASTIDDLKAILKEYVAADGKYMPFTKSIHLKLPFEGLKDIRVIDTPGLNDPVASREIRTNELLAQCDAVFIVSPANQFLTNEDMQLMERITEKEGVQELYLIASQVDNTLYGSDIKTPKIKDALHKVVTGLGHHSKITLKRHVEDHPEIKGAFNTLIEDKDVRVIPISGISYGILKSFSNQDSWDNSEQTAWKNLIANYPSDFSEESQDKSVVTLEKLSNISLLRKALEATRNKKEGIKAAKKQHLLQSKLTSIDNYQKSLKAYILEKEQEIRTSDINDLYAKKQEIESIKNSLSVAMNDVGEELCYEVTKKYKDRLEKILAKLYQQTSQDNESAIGSRTVSEEIESRGVISWCARGLGMGGYETKTYSETVVNSTRVGGAIQRFINQIDRDLKNEVKDISHESRTIFFKKLTQAYRSVSENDVDALHASRAIQSVVRLIPDFEMKDEILLPDDLSPQGELLGSEAEDYSSQAEVFIRSLEQSILSRIDEFLGNVERGFPNDLGGLFFEDLNSGIQDLIDQINNKEETLERLQKIKFQLSEGM